MVSNPFWNFSLCQYAKASVQQLMLELQDQAGANVNLLLFAAWLAVQGRHFDSDVLTGQADFQYWHDEVTLSLRKARYAAKGAKDQNRFYAALKKIELDAERVEQDLLYSMTLQFGFAQAGVEARHLAEENLRVYLHTLPLSEQRVSHYAMRLAGHLFDE